MPSEADYPQNLTGIGRMIFRHRSIGYIVLFALLPWYALMGAINGTIKGFLEGCLAWKADKREFDLWNEEHPR